MDTSRDHRFIITRNGVQYVTIQDVEDPELFHVRPFDVDPCHFPCRKFRSPELARLIDDMEQERFSQEVPLEGSELFEKLMEEREE